MKDSMGTTGTPGSDGASVIDEEDKVNGSAEGVPVVSLGGEVDDPLMPFDDKVDAEGKLHLPRDGNSTQRG
ncbi:hypothetical protein ACQP00_27985 [Dactylosporangium sp. CS-047395]|uniref:hypothetical protein n=1 Tax=Dactylosporangium sp. CS-047395 TaxID=3239936 RepID=UPI003D8E4C7A